MLLCLLGTVLFSCTPESQVNAANEVACCGEDGHIPPPPPPPPNTGD
jgi:hypothetical protein